ncbi:MAG: glycosyltransferase family 4 protein [Thermoplasmata archaeon]
MEDTIISLSKHVNIEVILINSNNENSKFKNNLIENNIKYLEYVYKSKLDLLRITIKLIIFFIKRNYDSVHCHLFEATLVGLTAASLTGIKKRYYTRHHSTYHHQYFPKATKYDKYCNALATKIISISNATYITLTQFENVSPDKIVTIYHGFKFINEKIDIIKNPISIINIRKKWNIPENKFVVGVVARLIEWKGIQYIIPAYKKFLNNNPESLLILANAEGPYKKQIEYLLSELPENKYILIPFENDVISLYFTFNIFIHTPIDELCEAFGQVYVEALSIGLPSIFTLSGIGKEVLKDNYNAMIVPYKNSDAIYKSMLELYNNKDLKELLRNNGPKSVKAFDKNIHLQKLLNLYNN